MTLEAYFKAEDSRAESFITMVIAESFTHLPLLHYVFSADVKNSEAKNTFFLLKITRVRNANLMNIKIA